MVKKVLYTILSKAWAMLLTFGLLLLTTHQLGKEGRGEISNWSAALNLITQFGLCFGGPALVYFASRFHHKDLLKRVAIYNTLLSIVSCCFLYIFYKDWSISICLSGIAFVNVVFYSYSMLLTGMNHINKVNTLNNVMVTVQIILFAGTCLWMQPSSHIYIYCLGAAIILTSWLAYLYWRPIAKEGQRLDSKQFLQKGIQSQVSNIFQMMNYRLSYFLIPYFLSESSLGVFSVAIALGEAIWIAGKSIALIHLGNISSGQIDVSQIKKAILVSFTITGMGCLFLYLLPNSFYVNVLGEGFSEVKQQLIYIFPGIILCSLQFVPASYFAGTGNFSPNNYAAVIGFVLTAFLNYVYIPKMDLQGAAMSFDVAMAVSSLFLLGAWYYRSKELHT